MAHALTARAFTTTIIAVAPPDRLADTTDVLQRLRARTAVRSILVTFGDQRQPEIRDDDDATIIERLVPRYLNNAVASLRLSSLPALAWWRGGDVSVLADLASLVDRLVLDSSDPRDDWHAAAPLVERTALGDLRWTRLTRWRNLMAQFFDVPDVRGAISAFSRLEIAGGDVYAARLFGGWMRARLPRGGSLAVDVSRAAAGEPLSSVSLIGPRHTLRLQLMPNGTCMNASLDRPDDTPARRIVSLGDQATEALLMDELRVRARDVAFEDALRCAVEML